MENTVKNIKLLSDFFYKRFINVGILQSANVDRLMFKNQLFIEFINEDIVDLIYPEIKKNREKMKKKSFVELLSRTVYTLEKPSKTIILNLIQFFNAKNAILNNIKNVPMKNQHLFELLNAYKYKIKKILIFPFYIYNHVQIQYIMKSQFRFLQEHSLIDEYNKSTFLFTTDLHIGTTFKKSKALIKPIIEKQQLDPIVKVDEKMMWKEDELLDASTTKNNHNHLTGGSRSKYTTKRLKYIIMEKLERYIDTRDIIAKNGIFYIDKENVKSPNYTKRYAIFFLMRAIIYFQSQENSNSTVRNEKYIMEHVKKHENNQLPKMVGIELRDELDMNIVISQYLETGLNGKELVINHIPVVIEQNKYYVEIINKLLDRLLKFVPKRVKGGVSGGGITERIRLGYKELKKRTRRVRRGVKDSFYLQFVSSSDKRQFLNEINRVFYYSFEKMIDEFFECLNNDLETGEISEQKVVTFFAKIGVSTFMVGHITCSFLSNFVTFVSTEVPSLFLFSLGRIPIVLSVQAVSCISGLMLISELFYFLVFRER
jgi:hypothetical protein